MTRPGFSVVVVPLVGQDTLANCLDRLPLDQLECIAVLHDPTQAGPVLRQRFRSVTFVEAREPVPLRRQRGVSMATGDVVALLEDTSWPDRGWFPAVRSSFADPATAAVGGSVQVAAELPARQQALGWTEYGSFSPHRAAQGSPASRVPGNNMAFRRTELTEALQGEADGLFEAAVCAKLVARGRRVAFKPEMRVTYAAADRHGALLRTRMHHGRIYASSHLRDQPVSARLVHAAKALPLPAVLTMRTLSTLRGSGRLTPGLLFWIGALSGAWALGEAIGALSGSGSSLSEWR